MSPQATEDFDCCDTTWRVAAHGEGAAEAVAAARDLARAFEKRLNEFDPASRVAELNRTGRVVDEHVARLVTRADEYRARTDGAFDIARGGLEQRIKAYVRGTTDAAPRDARRAHCRVEGDVVTTDAPLDLNGIAKGYVVDRVHDGLVARGVDGFVDGGGDIAGATGPVGIDSPYEEGATVGVLDTRWNIATSGKKRRRRGAVDHIYDPRDGRVGALHDQVTVVAKRDCTEADVLATVLALLSIEDGSHILERFSDVEALWIDAGALATTKGFDDHIWHGP